MERQELVDQLKREQAALVISRARLVDAKKTKPINKQELQRRITYTQFRENSIRKIVQQISRFY